MKNINDLKQSLPDHLDYDFKEEDLNLSVDSIIELLWRTPEIQNPSSAIYLFFKNFLILKYSTAYENSSLVDSVHGVKIEFPYITMGNINSKHFFGIDELLIYKFYKENLGKYHRVCDIGANVGLHSKILCELGYQVDSYEPDLTHSKIARNYLEGYSNHTFHQSAVSNYKGTADFTRIVNNTTGSYINNKKKSYGPTEVYQVTVEDALELAGKFDLFKIDAEGSEVDILKRFSKKEFETADFIAEISTEETRIEFWDYFSQINVPVYAQKISWRRVKSIDDLPTSHREGTIFISKNNTWL